MSVSAGSEDAVLGMGDVKKIQEAFEEKGGVEKGFEVVVVEGAKHGFAVRGDTEKEDEKRVSPISTDYPFGCCCWFIFVIATIRFGRESGDLMVVSTITLSRYSTIRSAMCQDKIYSDFGITTALPESRGSGYELVLEMVGRWNQRVGSWANE